MPGAEEPGMTNSSSDASTAGEDLSCSQEATRCETCHEPVDLASSLIFKRNRVMACRKCSWGESRFVSPGRPASVLSDRQ